LTIQRYDSYRREIGSFQNWLQGQGIATIHQITSRAWENWYLFLAGKLKRKEWAPTYCKAHLLTSRMFVLWLAEDEANDYTLPKKINSKSIKFKIPKPTPKPVPVETVQLLLNACQDQAQKTGLFILLAVQCGMYQGDISDLSVDEVNLEAGTLTRPRSKTPDGPVVTYKLWPETLALLKRFKATKEVRGPRGNRFLLTEDGNPWVIEKIGEDGIHKKTDNVHSAWERLRKRLKLAKPVQFMGIRKTGANALKGPYKFFQQYFLGHSPRTVAEQHYCQPDDKEFFEACDWLRTQILPAGWQPKFAD
jgi:integrase